MRISIVIPALNEEKLIKGILEQFDTEIRLKYDAEVIVSDGGSSDKTVSMAEAFSDKVVSDKESIIQNISRGRNLGAENSTGDVLVFLNADVLIADPDFFLSEVKKFADNKSVLAMACRIKVFPDEENFGDRLFHSMYNNYVYLLNKFFVGMGRGECQIVKRESFFGAGRYNENVVAGEDFDLFRRLSRMGKVVFRRDLLVYESPRRFRKYGYARIFFEWTKNAAYVLMFGKSASKKWESIR